jgi:hypothetical protein
MDGWVDGWMAFPKNLFLLFLLISLSKYIGERINMLKFTNACTFWFTNSLTMETHITPAEKTKA